MKNIIVINYLAVAYSVVIGLLSYIFFKDYYVWAILGSATALFNQSLMVRFTKNKITKDMVYLLIAFKFLIYLIMLGYMFFTIEDSTVLSYSYLFFLVGAINVKMGIFIFHLPFKAFKKMRADEVKEVDSDASIT